MPAAKTIIMVHGLGEHGGRYEHWAEKFTSEGYNFVCPDLKGHGRSEGKRGHISSMNAYLDDLAETGRFINEVFPGNSVILYGHSLGGTIALNYVILRNPPIKALITTSPWLRLMKEPTPPLSVVAAFLNKFLPFIALSNGLDPFALSHDPEVGRKYKSDPLVHDRISARLFHVASDGGQNALRNIYKINCPYLIMHGTSDSITSSKASENYVLNTSSRTRLKLWDSQYHELHNEFIKDEVFDYISNWLKEHKL